jgi:hypothetical protein
MDKSNDVKGAHSRSSHHRDELSKSDKCGCFYCLGIYPFGNIEEWCDDENTAICPICGVDSVIGSASGYPITKEFLADMKKVWF